MSKEWLAASEIQKLDLRGLPKTKTAILNRAKKERWPLKEAFGKGGKRLLFRLPEHYMLASGKNGKLLEKSGDGYLIIQPEWAAPLVQIPPQTLDQRYAAWAERQIPGGIVPVRYYKSARINHNGRDKLPFEHEEPEAMWLHRSFFSHQDVNPAYCICTRIGDSSMYPTIKPNNLVLWHLEQHYSREDIYLIRQGMELKAKRLQRLSPSLMRIISDNHSLYPLIDLDLSILPDNEFQIYGRYLLDCGATR